MGCVCAFPHPDAGRGGAGDRNEQQQQQQQQKGRGRKRQRGMKGNSNGSRNGRVTGLGRRWIFWKGWRKGHSRAIRGMIQQVGMGDRVQRAGLSHVPQQQEFAASW